MFNTPVIPKTSQEIQKIRIAWEHLTTLLWELRLRCVPGATTLQLELYAEQYLSQHHLTGAFKWYSWFPTNLCTSLNDCVVHGVPDDTVLKPWDLLKVDCWVTYKWCLADAAFSIVIWWEDTNTDATHLVHATKDALDESIQVIKPWVVGKTFWKGMKRALTSRNVSIIKNLTWHGVGTDVHEYPSIYNRPQNSMKKRSFVEGMVCAIEPITALSSDSYRQDSSSQHNIYTRDWDLWAQREYTILVTRHWYEILAWLEDIA